MPEFEPHDRVITPTDELARVVEVQGPDLELEYVHALNADTARFSLRASLCRRWAPDTPRPLPVKRRR